MSRPHLRADMNDGELVDPAVSDDNARLLQQRLETAAQILQAARDAETAGNFALALALWQQSAADFGDTRDTMMGAGLCLRETGALMAAEEILTQAQRKYPDDAEIAGHYALIPAAREDWLAASSRWRAVIERFPELLIFYGVAAVTYAKAGLHDHAEDLLRQALAKEPNSLHLRIQHAIAAQFAERWDDAVARWDLVLQIEPANPAFQELRGSALMHSKYNASASNWREETYHPAAEPSSDAEFANIVSCFESLGDNCELGLVQREFGAEPVGLFRFSAVAPLQMIELLDQNLALLGDPTHTLMTEHEGELIIYDDRGYFWMHSGVRKGQMDEAKYLKQQSARMTLLKRKFLLDLSTSSKIYVCKETNAAIADDVLRQISWRLNAFGRNLLLGMRLADQDNPAGSIRWLQHGIMVGHVSRMFGGENKIIDLDGWKSVLSLAYHYRSSAETA